MNCGLAACHRLGAYDDRRRTPAGSVARWWRRGSFVVLLGVLMSDNAVAQTTWQVASTPNNGSGYYCHDVDRASMVFIGRGDTFELDTNNSWGLRSSGFQGTPSGWFGGLAYDRTRRRVVCHDGIRTWHWDGTVWTMAATYPPGWRFLHIVAHEGRGTVMAFGGPNYWNSNDLYEWDGTNWNILPATVKPPRPGDYNVSQVYLTSAYDARRDRLVLYGSATVDWNGGPPFNLQPALWEWDATNGWVSRAVQGGLILPCALFFDGQRGVMTRLQGRPLQSAE